MAFPDGWQGEVERQHLVVAGLTGHQRNVAKTADVKFEHQQYRHAMIGVLGPSGEVELDLRLSISISEN